LKHCIDRMAAMASCAAHDTLPSALDQARGASTIEQWPGDNEGKPMRKEFHPRPRQ
jgi:hypothetical protein